VALPMCWHNKAMKDSASAPSSSVSAHADTQDGKRARKVGTGAEIQAKIAGVEVALKEDLHTPVLKVLEEERANVFLTGRAGTGKSTLISRLVARAGQGVAVLAPTGLAALNVGGQTVHSFFRFPPRLIEPADIKKLRHANVIRALKTLVIDEASMLRADMIHAIDASLRLHKASHAPFGGVQMVLVGDLQQLPPVVEADLEAYFENTFGGPYFFHPPGFRDANMRYAELTQVFRQTEPAFLELLAAVRRGEPSEIDPEVMRAIVAPMDPATASETHVVLTGSNAAANAINGRRLAALPGAAKTYAAKLEGEFDERAFPTETDLTLKIGARVMLLKNDSEKRWVNGSIGVIVGLGTNRVEVNIGGEVVEIEPTAWERVRYAYDASKQTLDKQVAGAFTQLPLRLAWALTIHKSQGLTLDRVYVDLDQGLFAHGQAYVALSRCRTLAGLKLSRRLGERDFRRDRRLLNAGKIIDMTTYDACRIGRFSFHDAPPPVGMV